MTGYLNLIIDAVEFINQYILIPLTIITFVLLVYFVLYIRRNDPDLIKSKIFLNFEQFISAFTILAVAAFVLIFHVILIYQYKFFDLSSSLHLQIFISKFQQLLGLVLTILLLLFAYRIFKIVK